MINLIGEGKGLGKKIQIGWNTIEEFDIGAGNEEYVYAFERIVLPLLRDFAPEFILVSCGFDSARDDLLGSCKLEADGYAYMTKKLIEIQPRISLILEGGYYPPQLQKCSQSVVEVLMNPGNYDEMVREMKEKSVPNIVGEDAVNNTLEIIGQYWSCLTTPELLEYQR